MSERRVVRWWQPSLPFASEEYETNQVWFTSKDGTRVPMFLVTKKGLALDGNRPTLLTAPAKQEEGTPGSPFLPEAGTP